MRRAILEALKASYEAEIAEADVTINIYLQKSLPLQKNGVKNTVAK